MKKSHSGIFLIVLGVILIIAGSFSSLLFILGASTPELIPFSGVISKDSYDVYNIGNVLVIDKYAFYEDGYQYDEDYYIIGFTDGESDKVYLASLTVDESMDIYEKLDRYADDDTAYIGDLYIELCATADTVSALDGDIYSYYNDEVDVYGEMLPGTEDSGISFTYYCEGAAAFPQASQSSQKTDTGVIIFGIAVFAIGIAVLTVGIIKTKNAKKQNQFYMQNQPSAYYYPPNQQPGTWQNQPPNPNQWTNGAANYPPQADGNAQYQQQNANEWTNGAPRGADNPPNPYYSPPAQDRPGNVNTPENGTPNDEQ